MDSHSGCWFPHAAGRAWRCFPLYAAQAPAALRAVPALGCSTKARNKKLRLLFASSHQSGSGSQELDGRTLPGCVCLLPSASPAPVPARAGRVPAPCVSPRPSRRMWTMQNLRRSLIRNWRPVCSAVGDAVFGAEFAPFPSALPPAGLGRSAACELFSGLARSLCSANSRQCVLAG